MEQHPVPQNVTTFQFRLIGDMTLKQFGYLAGGAVLAYICYKLPLPLFLNWPLAIIAGLGGFGFAFVPIEERPMDVWVLSFFKSIYSPTQYIWSKNAPQPAPAATAAVPPPAATTVAPPAPMTQPQPRADQPLAGATRRGDILSTIFSPVSPGGTVLTQQTAPVKFKNPFDWFFELLIPKPRVTVPAPDSAGAPQMAFPSTVTAKMDFTPPPAVRPRDEAIAETTKKELQGKPVVDSHVLELQKQMADLTAERDKMEAELSRLRMHQPQADRPLAETAPPVPPKPTGTYIATPASRQGPSVRIITQDRAVKAGLPRLTTFPNVVTGIVKDGDQNLLPGVLITVKDKGGIPVRALKTNRLGQFAASTQLTNGTYFVETEDPRLRYTFDRAQITLNGTIVPALEIFAKSQKEITRAKLEKELFGSKT